MKTMTLAVLVGLFACVPPAVTPDAGTQCPATAESAMWGAGTIHSAPVTADELWRASDSPHRVNTNLDIGAVVTIEPCSVVLVGAASNFSSSLRLGAGGRLLVEGSARQPILIRGVPDQEGVERFTGLIALQPSGEVMRLSHVTIERGGIGSDARGDYLISLDGAAYSSQQTLHVDTVTLRDSYGGGVYLAGTGRFASTSKDLTITGTRMGQGLSPDTNMPVSSPVRFMNPDAVASLPSGAYLGNEVDHIGVGAFGSALAALTASATWNDPGVPYFMRGGLRLVPSIARPTLTLNAGVTLKWTTGTSESNRGRITVGYAPASDAERATLIVAGTAAKPVTMEGVTNQPGAWSGIMITEGGRDTQLDHLVLRHAGLWSSTSIVDCSASGLHYSIAINYGWNNGAPLQPPQTMITNTSVSDGRAGSTGILRGWTVLGPAGTMSTDFLAPSLGNTVTGSCRQSGYTIVPPSGPTMCSATCE